MYKAKLNKTKLVSHFHYDILNYIIGIIVVTIVWFLCYYYIDPPANKKIDIYYLDSLLLDSKFVYHRAFKSKFPEIPRIRIYDYRTSDTITFNDLTIKLDVFEKQKTKLIKTNPGDIYIFQYELFSQWAKKGLLISLDDYVERFYDNELLTPQEFSELMVIHPYESRDAVYGIKVLDETGSRRYELIIGIGNNAGNKEKAFEVMKWLIYNLNNLVGDYG